MAEDVEKVNPDLVVRDNQGKPYSVRYDQVNAMLLNEFLKEHRKVEELTKDFESKLVEQEKQIKALTSTLEKVSARIELSRPTTELADGALIGNAEFCSYGLLAKPSRRESG